MRPTTIHYADRNFFELCLQTEAEVEPGKWAPARCLGTRSGLSRLYAAWLVFTGRADALKWIRQ